MEKRHRKSLRDDLLWMVANSRAPRRRSMLEFAESEIRIPDGPFEGRRYRTSRQPYARLWFDAVDSGQWSRHVATGPVQSGKSLTCFVIPILYHLFEVGETVICGLPSMEVASDKWEEDIRPVIEASRYRDQLPSSGKGSRSGTPESIKFRNGATLKFLSGGGSDKKRAGFTGRVLVITETDGMDESGETSREADKITQMEARTRAHGSNAAIYMECTVSIEEGRTWQEYQNGTASRIVVPCGACGAWISPGRDDLKGWEDADNAVQAKAVAHFYCPECGIQWGDDDRVAMNTQARLLHRGQEIEGDQIVGDPPQTETLGFRWSGFNNLFLKPGDIGGYEWKGRRSEDEDNAEKELRQFVWALPYIPRIQDAVPVNVEGIMSRARYQPHGVCPEGTTAITVACDVQQRVLYWLAMAHTSPQRSHVIDYGVFEVQSDALGIERGITIALAELKDRSVEGWEHGSSRRPADQVWIDSGWQAPVIYQFVRGAGVRFRAAKGFGYGQIRDRFYNPPKERSKGNGIRFIGPGYHFKRIKAERLDLVELNADHWKGRLHSALQCTYDADTALTLFEPHESEPRRHFSLAKHWTAEKEVEGFEPNKGLVRKWDNPHGRPNHWFDAAYMALCAGDFVRRSQVKDRPPAERSEGGFVRKSERAKGKRFIRRKT